MQLLIKLDRSWIKSFEGQVKNVLSTDCRRLLCKEANMNKANLTMYAKSLFKKQCLFKNEDGGTEVNRMFFPDPIGDIVEYTITLDMGE